MKKIFFTISFLLIFLLNFSLVNAKDNENTYGTPIIDNSLNFQIEYNAEKNKVYTSWNTYKGDDFKYYKVMKSQKNSNPVYPDDNAMKYYANQDSTEYTDIYPMKGNTFYRVCVITKNLDRYCSSVIELEIEKIEVNKKVAGKLSKVEHKPSKVVGKLSKVEHKSPKLVSKASKLEHKSPILEYKIQIRLNKIINKLINKIDKKDISDKSKIDLLSGLTSKLENLSLKKPALKNMVDYIVLKINLKIESYNNDISEIEKIFNEY